MQVAPSFVYCEEDNKIYETGCYCSLLFKRKTEKSSSQLHRKSRLYYTIKISVYGEKLGEQHETKCRYQ